MSDQEPREETGGVQRVVRRRGTGLSTLVPALTGLVGVLLGAALTGYFQLQSARLAVEKDTRLETARASRELSQQLTTAASEYVAAATYFATLTENDFKDKLGLATRHRHFEAKTLTVALLTSPPTSLKILATSGAVGDVLRAKASDSREQAREKLVKTLGEAYVGMYLDVAKYRWRGSPEAGTDELLYSIIQMLMTAPGQKSSNQPLNPPGANAPAA